VRKRSELGKNRERKGSLIDFCRGMARIGDDVPKSALSFLLFLSLSSPLFSRPKGGGAGREQGI